MHPTILTDAVEAAAIAQYRRATAAHPGAARWEDCLEADRAVYRNAVRPHIEAAAPLIAAAALQEAATAFATTAPTETAWRSLEYPAMELRAMAHRHTITRRPVFTPVPVAAGSAGRTAGTGALRRAIGGMRPARTSQAA